MVVLLLVFLSLNIVNVFPSALNNEYDDDYDGDDYGGDFDYLNGRSCKPALQPPSNGRILGVCDSRVGQVCNFECNKGYKIKGFASVVCSSAGVWTSREPTCVPIHCCPELKTPEHGSLEGACGKNANIGDKCVARCSAGFQLEGMKVIECLAGCIWSSDVPICKKEKKHMVTCPSLSPPLFGSHSGACTPGMVDQECLFQCQYGYYLVGAPKLTCLSSGSWSSSIPYCQRKQGCVGKCCIIPCFG